MGKKIVKSLIVDGLDLLDWKDTVHRDRIKEDFGRAFDHEIKLGTKSNFRRMPEDLKDPEHRYFIWFSTIKDAIRTGLVDEPKALGWMKLVMLAGIKPDSETAQIEASAINMDSRYKQADTVAFNAVVPTEQGQSTEDVVTMAWWNT